jgi:hypothetical protein
MGNGLVAADGRHTALVALVRPALHNGYSTALNQAPVKWRRQPGTHFAMPSKQAFGESAI